MSTPAALEGIRVLELSGFHGAYCGKLFADLGAEVTLIEPPGGSMLRAKPPFAADGAGAQTSLAFAYFAANKRSIVLDLLRPEGQSALRELVANAQLIVVGDHPDAERVDLAALRDAHPVLVCTRISPYGSDGPYAAFVGDDLTLMAMGGLLNLGGHPEGPPTVAYGEQGVLAADQFAACASLAAVLSAEQSGAGELIDVSIQESIVMGLENAAQTYQLAQRVRQRAGGPKTAGSGIFKCKEGEIYLLAGGIGETAMWSNFAAWLCGEHVAGAETFADSKWSDAAFNTSPQAHATFARVFEPFARTRTKQELYEGGRRWRVPTAPMSSPADLLANAQLQHRGFFVPSPAGCAIAGTLVPGAPYKLVRTPWRLHSAAPPLPARTTTRS